MLFISYQNFIVSTSLPRAVLFKTDINLHFIQGDEYSANRKKLPIRLVQNQTKQQMPNQKILQKQKILPQISVAVLHSYFGESYVQSSQNFSIQYLQQLFYNVGLNMIE
ncbi:hypothetical protein ABPG74_002742 [Tetrahymena malaccensis]